MLPCSTCIGCRKAHAQAWALRCHLENQNHATSVFTTLTYNEATLPPTLTKRHLQLFLKRLRKNTAQPIRFFGCGEYGEKRNRPHYHAILYGLSEQEHSTAIRDAWGLGFTQTAQLTPRRIAYTAGYVDKKLNFKEEPKEQVDPETGEVYTWQPPFIQMSHRPGIGSHARQFRNSWRTYAVWEDTKLPVPRFLHKAWRDHASEEDLALLQKERDEYRATIDQSLARLEAAEQIAAKKQQLAAEKRRA